MIQLIDVKKNYGNVVGINGVSFTVRKGSVMGLLGKNGAGKSTIMNVLTGYLCPDAGSVLLDGVDIWKDPIRAKQKFGYMPESPPVYNELTVEEYLRFAAAVNNVNKGDIKRLIDRVCAQLQLESVRGRLIGTLSKGYKQRVGIAQALCHEARIIILDEPTSGLDPQQIVDIKDTIRSMKGEYTVLFSSHILSEVVDVCDEVTIINAGKVLESGGIDDIVARHADHGELVVTVKGDIQHFAAALAAIPGVKAVQQSETYRQGARYIIQCERDLREEVFRTAVASGVVLLDMKSSGASLEDIFIKLTRQ